MPLATRELTQLHRRQQLALRKVTASELQRLWPALEWEDLDGSYPKFAGSVATLVGKNRRTSAGLAAQYLRAYRVASGLDGNLRIVIPQMLPAEQFKTSLRVTSLIAAKKSAAALVPADVAMSNALTQASGAMVRLVLNAGRETVNETVRGDSKALGWRRVLGGGGCDFCREIAGSGSRIYPRDNADFDAHDRCGCTSEPAY